MLRGSVTAKLNAGVVDAVVTPSLTIQSVKFAMRGLASVRPTDITPVPEVSRLLPLLVSHVATGANPVVAAVPAAYVWVPFWCSQLKLRWLANMRPPRLI